MNGKKSRKLRKIVSVQVGGTETKLGNSAYKDMKQLYKNQSIKLHK